MPLVIAARLRVRAPEFMPVFGTHATQSIEQVKTAAGCLATNFLQDNNLTFWNCSIWKSETAMQAYMRSGAHKAAMPDLAETCCEAVMARWEQADASIPSWLEVHEKIVQTGKGSKLNYPSLAQETRDFPLPRVLTK